MNAVPSLDECDSLHLDVKNGMLGTVVAAADGVVTIELDDRTGRQVTVQAAEYDAIDYGYASTIHKSQGATVDRSFVLASGTMDRHLSYVAMSRHREDASLYADREQFASFEALTMRLGRERLKRTTLDYEVVPMSPRKPAVEELGETPTQQRVGWTQTYNLGKTKDAKAWRMMQATADNAGALKEAAGLRQGKKTSKPVYHFSLTWPKVDRPEERLQRQAVDEALEVLGLDGHQALAVQHLNGAPHVHIMVNLINPDTGLSASRPVLQANGKEASKLSHSHRKLRQWANRFEKQHGLQITQGSLDNARRRAAGEQVDARRKSRVSHDRGQREGVGADFHWFRTHQKKAARDVGENDRGLKARQRREFRRLHSAFESVMDRLAGGGHASAAQGARKQEQYVRLDNALRRRHRQQDNTHRAAWQAYGAAREAAREKFQGTDFERSPTVEQGQGIGISRSQGWDFSP